MRRIRRHLTFANVIAVIALFVALGGAGYAAFRLPRNSVRSRNIKNGQVKSADVKDNGLTGADIDESSLGKVPSAAHADAAGNADTLDGKDSTDFALAGAEGWQSATLNDGSSHGFCWWSNFDNGYGYN